MKTICTVSSTRADYGTLKPLLNKIYSDPYFDLRLVVTGTHLVPEFGMTVSEIENNNIPIHKKIKIFHEDIDTSRSMGVTLTAFGEYFKDNKPDILLVFGDRFEIFSVCCAAVNNQIPIVHLCGGDVTEGMADDFFRHGITKMSHLHFPSCPVSQKRVIQLGESPDRVFSCGDLSIDNIMNEPLVSLQELEKDLGFSLQKRPYAIVTYHPVTLEHDSFISQMTELTNALSSFPDIGFIITKANADKGVNEINTIWDEYCAIHNNCLLVASLGMRRYLSALKHCTAVIGNSSSGILEAPAIGVPTVNIGDRQKGRSCAESVLNCDPKCEDIVAAMEKALSSEFISFSKIVDNPYGDGNASEKIVAILKRKLEAGIPIKKKFYDIKFEI
jgi:GDP/UDP-N,N'-diacetylbacillosamine 2-epimerase (hydrolysing)